MFKRRLGRSGIEVSAMGLGCWAIGGPWAFDDEQAGWGEIDDAESIRAIHCALDLGINFFDTAANYGTGHSERVLGQALAGRRDQVVIATKFGFLVDEENRLVHDDDDVVGHIRRDCDGSLQRLGTDYIDLYQLHVGPYDPQRVDEVRNVLEELVADGKIRWYGWSTDNPTGARIFAAGAHCAAVQHLLNMVSDAPDMLAVCDEYDLASINRRPLGSGLLTGKLTPATQFPQNDTRHDWNLREGRMAERLAQIEAGRATLTARGRTVAQTALLWLWARSPRTIPIPGFRNIAQVQQNAQTMELTPLSADEVAAIDHIFGRN